MSYTQEELKAQLKTVYDGCTECCLGSEYIPEWKPEDVKHVILASSYGECEGEDESGIFSNNDGGCQAVVELNDGSYGWFEESQDYSGHGCQCGAMARKAETMDNLLKYVIVEGALSPGEYAVLRNYAERERIDHILYGEPRAAS